MPEPKKRIRGLINRNQATQFEQLGIELGPSPAQRAEEEKRRKLRERAMQAREAMAKSEEMLDVAQMNMKKSEIYRGR